MRIDYLMQENISSADGYKKGTKGDVTIIFHIKKDRVICVIKETLKTFRMNHIPGIKSKTYEQIKNYFKEKGYKQV